MKKDKFVQMHIISSAKEVNSFPIHKECRNFRNGFCMALGIPVNPNGSACPMFTPRNNISQHAEGINTISPSRASETNLEDLKHKLEDLDIKLQKIKNMLREL